MKRTRVAAFIIMDGGLALMHRKNVEKKEGSTQPYGEYYVFPGGGLENDETLTEGVIREVKEEFGIIVNPLSELLYKKIDDERDEYLLKCEYVSGTFGTGDGPEFSGDPKYKSRGEYLPEIIPLDEVKNIRLIPEEFKMQLIELGLI